MDRNMLTNDLQKRANSKLSIAKNFVQKIARGAKLSSRQKKSLLSIQVIFGLIVTVAHTIFTPNVALASLSTTTANVNGNSSFTAYPGQPIPVTIGTQYSNGTDWEG